MRFLSADILFTANETPKKNGVVVVEKNGLILDVLDKDEIGSNQIEYYPGALCPGFINTHCHIELSHLLGRMEKHKGLSHFIKHIVSERECSEAEVFQGIVQADEMMYKNGIVAVGDISNTSNSFLVKDRSSIYYHTFVELFASSPDLANNVFQNGIGLLKQCQHSCSLSPHSSYSVSNELFRLLKSANKGEPISIHNQETASEDTLFYNGKGALFEELKNISTFKPTGLSALRSILPVLPDCPILLVHNTFTSESDIQWAISQHSDLYWATCPKANQFIENTLPNYSQFISKNVKMTIGTDSLASNDTLCVLEEMKTINHLVTLEQLIQWACKNGADFLGLKQLGTIEKGKTPGINHIKHLSNDQLTAKSNVNRIV